MSIDRFNHKVDRKVETKPARLQRIEVITGVERRRAWSREEKRPRLGRLPDDARLARNQPDRLKAGRDTAILMLAFGLALRRAEIVAINVGDVDLGGGRLSIIGKGRAEPVFPTLPASSRRRLANGSNIDRRIQPRRSSSASAAPAGRPPYGRRPL